MSAADIPLARLPDRQTIERDLTFFLSASGVPAIGVDISVAGKRLNVAAGKCTIGESLSLTDASRFRVSCLIKVLGSVVCLKLAEAGLLDIEVPIGTYLPELGVAEKSKGGIMRVRHLLMHTGGYRALNALDGHLWGQWSWDECVGFLQKTPQLFGAGAVFNEGHFDHVILGKILERITGQSVEALIRKHIFEPLGIEAGTAAGDMTGRDLYVHGHRFMFQNKALEEVENPGKKESAVWASSLSDLTLSVRDITTIGEALLNDIGRSPGRRILSSASLKKLQRTVIPFPSTFGAGLDTNWRPRAFNLAFAIFGGGQMGYFAVSQGQNCGLIVDPRYATCVTVALNAAAAKVRVAILNCIFSRIRGSAQPAQDFLIPPPANVDFDKFIGPFRPHQLEGRYVGCFADDMIVTASPNRIDFRLGKAMKLALVRSQDNRLKMEAQAPVPIGFFPEPESGRPAVVFGMYTFKKRR